MKTERGKGQSGMVTTKDLITMLAADARPVRPLRPPLLRCAYWLALAAIIVVALGISLGLRPDLTLRFRSSLFTVRVLAALITGILAAVSAFQISMPDRSARWALLSAPAIVVWVLTIGYECLYQWINLDPGRGIADQLLRHVATMTLAATPLSLALLLMMYTARPLRFELVALCGALSVGAITATALTLLLPFDATAFVLLCNLGVALFFMGLGWIFGSTSRTYRMSS